MNWEQIYQNTFIPELPKIWNRNFKAFQNYIDVFYDASRGIIVKPLVTTGRVKAATGEFVTLITDNLIVKNTSNISETSTTSTITTLDTNYVDVFNGPDVTTRTAIDREEDPSYDWVDVDATYYKINNELIYGFNTDIIGQEIQLIFNTDIDYGWPFEILLGYEDFTPIDVLLNFADADLAWIKLIAVDIDDIMGTTWSIKEYGGNFTVTSALPIIQEPQ